MKEDLTFAGEKLYYRTKFHLVKSDNIKAIAFYFVCREGVYCPGWADYAEVSLIEDRWSTLNILLTKTLISLEDTCELALQLGLVSDYYKTNKAELLSNVRVELEGIDIDALYFSLYD